jgi:transposase
VLDVFSSFALSRKWGCTARAASSQEQHDLQPTARRRLMWEQVQKLAGEGLTIRAVARSLGMHRRTVRALMGSAAPTPRRVRARPLRKLGPYLGYMLARWDAGVRNSAALYREVRGRGYEGSYSMLRRVAGRWRKGEARPSPATPGHPLRLARRWRRDLGEEETAELDRFLGANPELAVAYGLKESFREAMAAGEQRLLDNWLNRAAASGLKAFQALARGMRRDYAAVAAAFTTPWSNGQTEGQVTRLKLIKRLGYGRANPDLLRARVLHRSTAA